MDLVAIAGLAALIAVKEAGVPLPVPGDLVIIGAGATLATDVPMAGIVLAVIITAGLFGASLQFLVFGSTLRRPLLAALDRLGVGAARLEALSDRFRRGGAASVAVARMTPGVRVGVIPAAAIARLPYLTFLPGVTVGNAVFVTAHFGLGFLLGAYATELIARAGIPIFVGGVLLTAAVVGAALLRSRRGARATRPDEAVRSDAYECWADCSCPVCVAVAARQAPVS